ncbi:MULTISPECIES: hypothetical protein [Gluconobacter]|uniref:hypothetical protein n=1 Tax=Gluconobacter TaxID=441 RepID=UPI0011AF5870|nr:MULTISPECIES: hypothetical protein [Gluconobacter]MBS1038366.1 hypothetical protein [Gluconobacter cerinus]
MTTTSNSPISETLAVVDALYRYAAGKSLRRRPVPQSRRLGHPADGRRQCLAKWRSERPRWGVRKHRDGTDAKREAAFDIV